MPPTKKKKKKQTAEDVALEAFPGFEAVKRPARDGKYLNADSTTPSARTLHRKYGSDSAREDAVVKKARSGAASPTQAVVIEPKEKKDAASKRLTILVKKGKIRAVQG